MRKIDPNPTSKVDSNGTKWLGSFLDSGMITSLRPKPIRTWDPIDTVDGLGVGM